MGRQGRKRERVKLRVLRIARNCSSSSPWVSKFFARWEMMFSAGSEKAGGKLRLLRSDGKSSQGCRKQEAVSS